MMTTNWIELTTLVHNRQELTLDEYVNAWRELQARNMVDDFAMSVRFDERVEPHFLLDRHGDVCGEVASNGATMRVLWLRSVADLEELRLTADAINARLAETDAGEETDQDE